MIVPIFASLHAVAAANALGRIEKNAARFAVLEPCLVGTKLPYCSVNVALGCFAIQNPFVTSRKLSSVVYHLSFMSANQP